MCGVGGVGHMRAHSRFIRSFTRLRRLVRRFPSGGSSNSANSGFFVVLGAFQAISQTKCY